MREQRGEKRLLKWVNWLCAIIFSVFSFTFTAVYQSPLVEVYYDKVATGKLEYNGYVVAAITIVIILVIHMTFLACGKSSTLEKLLNLLL